MKTLLEAVYNLIFCNFWGKINENWTVFSGIFKEEVDQGIKVTQKGKISDDEVEILSLKNG